MWPSGMKAEKYLRHDLVQMTTTFVQYTSACSYYSLPDEVGRLLDGEQGQDSAVLRGFPWF